MECPSCGLYLEYLKDESVIEHLLKQISTLKGITVTEFIQQDLKKIQEANLNGRSECKSS